MVLLLDIGELLLRMPLRFDLSQTHMPEERILNKA